MNEYKLRKVREDDMYDVYRLSNEDYVRMYSIHPNKISWEEHVKWFNDVVVSDYYVFYVIEDREGNFSGQIRYKIENHGATVSISLCRPMMGKGLSYKILLRSIELLSSEQRELKEIIAYVMEQNVASIKLFEKSGFKFHESKKGLIKFVYSLKKEVL